MGVALLLCFAVGYLPNSTTMVESELSAAVMAITYMLTRSIGDIYILLPLRIAVAALLYVAALYLFRSAEMREAVDYIKTRKTKPSEQ